MAHPSPLVSVIIPAYNAQRWLGAAIESALAQSWPRVEVVVVDDGSTDGSMDIARRYGSRVAAMSQYHQGGGAARNLGLAQAQGDFIQWLDADDLLAPDKVERQMETWRRLGDPRAAISGTWAHFMYRPTRARFQPSPLWEDLSPVDWMVRKWTHNAQMQTATWLVTRELTNAAGPWNEALAVDQDGEYFSRVLRESHTVRFCRGARVYYRTVGSSRVSHIGSSTRKVQSLHASMWAQIELLRRLDDGPDVRAAVLCYLRTWLPTFHPAHPEIVARMRALAESLGGSLDDEGQPGKRKLVDGLMRRPSVKALRRRYNVTKTAAARAWAYSMCAMHIP